MVFQNIFGQEQAINLLKHDLYSGNIAHAYLFSGSTRIGKTKTAFAFAKAIACPEGGCLSCVICQSFDKVIHPDFKIIQPQGNFIGIEQIRKLEQWVVYKASQAQRKVVIIEEVERLTEEAANALLKTLEEPQESVVFICITSNQNSLLPTLVSRCRQINFRPIAFNMLVEYLQKQGHDAQKAYLAAKLSQGIFGKAIDLMENEKIWQLRREILNCVKEALIAPVDQTSFMVDSFLASVKTFQASGTGKDIKRANLDILFQALDFWGFWLRDVVIFAQTKDKEVLINTDLFDEIEKHCQNSEVRRNWLLMQQIPKIKELINKNINQQLVLETTLLKALGEI